VDKREREADGDRCEALERALVGRPEDNRQEHERHHDLGDQRREQRVAARRMLGVAVRGEAGVHVESGVAAGDDEQHRRGKDPAEDLRDDVRDQVLRREAAARRRIRQPATSGSRESVSAAR
jgi:hypothetical protein